ncbi:MAG: hypothetical protein COY01_03115 [Candidatus Pacebacteria bacterium CG_4_10_14_0_2_um_filter_40_20]|nr:MAG: hypothetical protein COY01_03115 [Candidatus Pacebacteria bacterium CG_4_10_14_0_2_um_filter_40_20]
MNKDAKRTISTSADVRRTVDEITADTSLRIADVVDTIIVTELSIAADTITIVGTPVFIEEEHEQDFDR